jgi:monoamine oxidase
MLRTAMSRAPPISVGIVGAGFAGLRCADILLQHGFKATILEARNRLGGRVGQSWHLGHPVDLYVNDFGAGTSDGGVFLVSRKGSLSSTTNTLPF